MKNRFWLLGTIMLVAATSFPMTASSQPPITVLPDCQGKPAVRPTSVVFACGDGGVYATGAVWSRWGEQFATATATLHANDCTPNCAQGHFHTSAVVLVVAGSQQCPGGRDAYRRVGYGPRTLGTPNAHSKLYWLDVPCK